MVKKSQSRVKQGKDFAKKQIGPPGIHWVFTALVVVAGWFAPPLAVVIRFGPGKDFFLNLILTLCGYIPGHVHNFYLQNIRNNNGRGRTPRWAVRYGLVRVKEVGASGGGKWYLGGLGGSDSTKTRDWARRYEERLPASQVAHHSGGYDYSPNASPSNSPNQSTTSLSDPANLRRRGPRVNGDDDSGSWDGRGPEPPLRNGAGGGEGEGGKKGWRKKKGKGDHLIHDIFTPWADEVERDDVEGYEPSSSRGEGKGRRHTTGSLTGVNGTEPNDPFANEEFYPSDGRQDGAAAPSSGGGGTLGKKGSVVRTLMTGTKSRDSSPQMPNADFVAAPDVSSSPLSSYPPGGEGRFDRMERERNKRLLANSAGGRNGRYGDLNSSPSNSASSLGRSKSAYGGSGNSLKKKNRGDKRQTVAAFGGTDASGRGDPNWERREGLGYYDGNGEDDLTGSGRRPNGSSQDALAHEF